MANGLARPAPSRRELALLTIAGTIAFFGLWQIIGMSGLVSKFVLPSPADVIVSFVRMVVQPFAGDTIQGHVLASLGRWALGFGLATLVGVPLGLAMGHWSLLDAHRIACIRGLSVRGAARLGSVCRALVRHWHRRSDHGHLCRRVRALCGQCLSRRATG